MTMTPAKYARQEIEAGRFPNMPILGVADSHYLCDGEWSILAGSKNYASKAAAEIDRSRILDRARKAIRT